MNPEHKQILEKIASLKEEYKAADQMRRTVILGKVKELCQKLPQVPENCVNCNMRKALSAEHEHGRFCGAECHKEWADKTYGVKRSGSRKSLAEMRMRLGEMAKEAHLRKLGNKQQSLL